MTHLKRILGSEGVVTAGVGAGAEAEAGVGPKAGAEGGAEAVVEMKVGDQRKIVYLILMYFLLLERSYQ